MHMAEDEVVQFLSAQVLELDPLSKAVFLQHLETEKVVLMLDGFDEISPIYKDIVINLLQVLKRMPVQQLWITTRPHLKELLEDTVQQFSHTLEPFSEEDQIDFLTKFWRSTLNIQGSNQQLKIYAGGLIKKLANSISDKDKDFTGVPLQIRMLAEAFDQDLKEFCESDQSVPMLPEKLDILQIYERFLNRKYLIYVSEKNNPSKLNVATTDLIGILKGGVNLRKIHQQLALKALFPEQARFLMKFKELNTLQPEKLNRIGIVQFTINKLVFIHRVFAEYYVADFLVVRLAKNKMATQTQQDFLLNQILLQQECQVIRSFFDKLLERNVPSEIAVKQYGERINQLWEENEIEKANFKQSKNLLQQVSVRQWENTATSDVRILSKSLPPTDLKRLDQEINDMWCDSLTNNDSGGTVLHQAVQDSSTRVMEFLLRGLDQNGSKTVMKNLLLYKDKEGRTAWYGAIVNSNIKILESLWFYVKKVCLTLKEFSEYLLARDDKERTTWHWVAWKNNIDLLHSLRNFSKEINLGAEAVFLAKDHYGRTIWHWAAQYATSTILGIIWELAKEVGLDRKKDLLLAKDGEEQTGWHFMTFNEHPGVVEKLWGFANEIQLNLRDDLFLVKDKSQNTIWHCAAKNGKSGVLKELWALAKKLQLDLREDLFPVKDKYGTSVWNSAIYNGTPDFINTLWVFAKEAELDLKTELLQVRDKDGHTAWHRIINNKHSGVFQALWALANEILDSQESKELFLQKNDFEQTAWSLAVRNNSAERLDTLWTLVKKIESDPLQLKKIFLSKDMYGQTIWHFIMMNGYADVLNKLLYLAKEIDMDFKNDLFAARASRGRSVWHWASEDGTPEILNKLWQVAKAVQVNLKDELLLLRDDDLRTSWHIASSNSHTGVLKELWKFSKEEQLNLEGILLAEDKNGETAWCQVVKHGFPAALEHMWEFAQELNLKTEFLLAKHQHSQKTVWHFITNNSNPGMLDTLSNCITEVQIELEELRVFFLSRDRFGQTAWYLAVKYNSIERLEKLWIWIQRLQLDSNALEDLILSADNNNHTTWHWAASNGNVRVMVMLWELAKKQNLTDKLLSVRDNSGKSAWHCAAEYGTPEALQTLWKLSKGAKETLKGLLLSKDEYERTVWHYAAINTEDTLGQLWKLAKEEHLTPLADLFSLRDKYGRTVLHLAAEAGTSATLLRLWEFAKETEVDLKEDFLVVRDNQQQSPWHWAVQNSSPETLNILLGFANEVNIEPEELILARDKNGRTALHVAASNKRALKHLWTVANRVKSELSNDLLSSRDNNGRTVLHLAARRGRVQAVGYLLEKGSDVFAKCNHDTVLHQAVASDNATVTSLILAEIKKKSNSEQQWYDAINALDNEGDTPLMWVAENGRMKVVKVLLEANVDIHLQNHKGFTALHWAIDGKHWEVAVKLESLGAEVNVLNEEQRRLLTDHIQQVTRSKV